MHTTLHLLCAALPGASVTGGQIGADRSRLDFDLPEPPAKEILEERLNALIVADHPVSAEWVDEAVLDTNPEHGAHACRCKPPRGTGRLRLVRIGAADATDRFATMWRHPCRQNRRNRASGDPQDREQRPAEPPHLGGFGIGTEQDDSSTPWFRPHGWRSNLGKPGHRGVRHTMYLPNETKNGRDEFRQLTSPARVFSTSTSIADQDTDAAAHGPDPRPLRHAGRQRLGVSNDSMVVFYDQKGLSSAARGWWMMGLFGHDRAAVLDGGLPKWTAEGRPVEAGDPPAAGTRHVPRRLSRDPPARRRRHAGERQLAGRTGAGRPRRRHGSAPRFPNPAPACAPATSRAAPTCPTPSCSPPTRRCLPPEALRARLAAAGVDGKRPVVTSCGSGVTATILTLAMTLAGLPAGAVYDGSWTEWGGRSDTPVETERGELSMPDDIAHRHKPGFFTRLSHAGRAGTHVHGFVNPPVHRGSTVLYPDMAERRAGAGQAARAGADLRRHGHANPLAAGERRRRDRGRHALPDRLVRPRRRHHAAAGLPERRRSLPDAGFRLRPGARLLRRLPVADGHRPPPIYDPCIDAAGPCRAVSAEHHRALPESPGSHTFEVQDVPALAASPTRAAPRC